MSIVETLTERNAAFAADRFPGGMKLSPKLRTIVIGCVDPRVPVELILGIELGEAAVIRNVGGRVTPALLAELAMLRKVSQAVGGDIGAGWEFIVLHHTDCGITRLADSPGLLSGFFGVDAAGLPAKAVEDPHAAVVVDVAALRADPALDDEIVVSGLVYDIATGRVETVVDPAPLRGARA